MKRGWMALVMAAGLAIVPVRDGIAASRGLTVELKGDVASPAPQRVRLYAKSHALIIGIDEYTAGWPRLSKAVEDARQMGAELQLRGFEVQMEMNLNADRLETVLEDFFIDKGSDPDARLFVWFAGHGHTERGNGYIIPADGPLPHVDRKQFRRRSINMRQIGGMVREADAKHVMVVFDSCFSGSIFDTARAAPPPAITRVTARPVRQFLTSGDAGQKVSDDGQFRRLFIDALRGERKADANGDGYLTASEMGLFLTDSVSNYTENRQTPRYGKLRDPDYDQGDFVFKIQPRTPPVLKPDSRTGQRLAALAPASGPEPQQLAKLPTVQQTPPVETDARMVMLENGLTIADWILLAEDRTDTDRLLQEAIELQRKHVKVAALTGLIDRTRTRYLVEMQAMSLADRVAAISFLGQQLDGARALDFAYIQLAASMESGPGWDAELILSYMDVLGKQGTAYPELVAQKAEALHHLQRFGDASTAYRQWLALAPADHARRKTMARRMLSARRNVPLYATESKAIDLFVTRAVDMRSGPGGRFSTTGALAVGQSVQARRVQGQAWYLVNAGYVPASALSAVNRAVVAARKKDDAAWQRAVSRGRISDFSRYVIGNPDGHYVAQADDAAWGRARELATDNAYQVYVKLFADGAHVEKAMNARHVLEQARIDAAAERDRQKQLADAKQKEEQAEQQRLEALRQEKQAILQKNQAQVLEIRRIKEQRQAMLEAQKRRQALARKTQQTGNRQDGFSGGGDLTATEKRRQAAAPWNKGQTPAQGMTQAQGAAQAADGTGPQQFAAVVRPVVRKPRLSPAALRKLTGDMVRIRPGSFRMGDLSGGGDPDEKPVRQVQVSYSFEVGKHEVTQAQWQAVMGDNPSYRKGDRLPVENISWNRVQDFIRKLNAMTGATYRLLTEAEWEYVARAGRSARYHWGNDAPYCLPDQPFGAEFDGDYPCNGSGPVPVGRYAANAWGVHDMHGNVWEWVQDCRTDNYQNAPGDARAVNARTGAACKQRGVRGGSWHSIRRELRAANRHWENRSNKNLSIGFRIARTL